MSDPDQPTPDQAVTDAGTTSATTTRPARTRWLYPTLAVTGITVGIFIVAAGLFMLFAPSSWHPAKNCCAPMEAQMKTMKDDMKKMPCMGSTAPIPSMSPMPHMPSLPPMPGTSPMPSMPMPSR